MPSWMMCITTTREMKSCSTRPSRNRTTAAASVLDDCLCLASAQHFASGQPRSHLPVKLREKRCALSCPHHEEHNGLLFEFLLDGFLIVCLFPTIADAMRIIIPFAPM